MADFCLRQKMEEEEIAQGFKMKTCAKQIPYHSMEEHEYSYYQ